MAQPQWKQVGHIGDVSWPEYDGGPVFVDETGVYAPELEYVEAPSENVDFEDPSARWTVYRVPLEKGVPDWGDINDVARTVGQDPGELRAAFESDDPIDRANAYQDWASHYGWFELDQYPLQLTCPEVNKRYDAGLNCYGAIQGALEEEVERMVDEDAASGWSYGGDQMAAELEDEGYDPASIVVEAEFGDAVAVNSDLLVGPQWGRRLGVAANELWANVGTRALDAWLEQNGYEYIDRAGGRVPTTEGHAYGDTVIDAVARQLSVPRERVEEAANALDWWQEEIPGSSSGSTYVWAKRR